MILHHRARARTHTQVHVLGVRADDKLIALISGTYLQSHQTGGQLRIARVFQRATRLRQPGGVRE